MPSRPSLAVQIVLLAFVIALFAARAVFAENDADLAARLQPLIDAHQGHVAVAVRHLASQREFRHRADEPMPTASLIKFPVMVEAYRQAQAGRIDMQKTLTLRSADKVQGSGILTAHFTPGMTLTLRDAVRLMIAYSDNTATNLVLEEIGLPATNAYMQQLGLPNTKIHAKVFRGDTSIAPERSKQFGLGSTTAGEMLSLLKKLHRRELVSETACDEMRGHLLRCEDKSRFPRFLPPGTKIAHKTGSVAAVRTAAGIIDTPSGAIALCVLTSANKDQRWVDDNAGSRLCAEIARAAYNLFNPPTLDEKDTSRGELKLGDVGELVMALQRTLNSQLQPSPNLSVDGDFGPSTEAAVLRFQRERKLKATGQVASAMWQALGPLLTADAPVPDPEVVNAERPETKPADPLDGPPFTSAKAWAVADGKTGEFLWGEHADEKLEIASTTKIMTAYVTLQLAAKNESLLEEATAVTGNAAGTGGTSADIASGDRLTVRQLLYGLLLPSGNDAAVALAEHLGRRCEPDAEKQTSLARFVAEMNRTAAKLELKETRFVNPHGLPDEGHVGSARDLAKLAYSAAQLPLFRQIITTRKLGLRIGPQGGAQRNVVWENRNELLGIAGYTGIKTGTTRGAGACLVSSGERGEDRLIVVVLGCPTNDTRYIDTRNLYRWAWQKRGHR